MVMDRSFLLQAIIQSFQPIGSVFDLGGVQISQAWGSHHILTREGKHWGFKHLLLAGRLWQIFPLLLRFKMWMWSVS